MATIMASIQSLENDLHLKQLQIKSLLSITQAINSNIPAEELFEMYRNFLGWEMRVERMALYIHEGDKWECATHINFPNHEEYPDIAKTIAEFERTERIEKDRHPNLAMFDVIIPVYHKDYPISFVLLGDSEEGEDFYTKIQFITTITNIISVAIENKRLFNQQLIQERFNREMELASEVQKLLIPDELPSDEGFELASIYKPHSNIGGDYFDYMPVGDCKELICIADIAGKGVAAALLMSNFQAFLKSQSEPYQGLGLLVERLNLHVFNNTHVDSYLTMFLAEYCRKTGRLYYVNAGHVPPILYVGGKIKYLDKGCTVIGTMPKLPELEIGVENIEKEAILFTYTDGLTDLKNDKGVFLDETKIADYIEKHNKRSAQELNKGLLKFIEKYRGHQPYPDDIAVLTCKIVV